MEQQVSWPGWEIGEKIGKGGFGTVYEIHRDMFGEVEQAALKVISVPQTQIEVDELRLMGYEDSSIALRYKEQLESIVQEYSLMRKLRGTSNVVHCDDVRYTPHEDGIGWTIYIKMELLTPMLKQLDAVRTEEQVAKLAQDLCSALVLCKQKNIIHRDIKPQNIFISENGDYKLGDFGIAKILERTSGGTRVGTINYMVPEVFNGQPYGHSSDCYSLGLVLYWLLNEKRMPFLPLPPVLPTIQMEEEALLRRFKGDALPPPAHGSRELKRIVLKACAFDPKQRYAAAADMLEDIKKLKPSSTVFLPVVDSRKDGKKAGSGERKPSGLENTEARTVLEPDNAGTVVLESQQKKKVSFLRKWWPVFAGGIAALVLGLCLLLRGYGDDQNVLSSRPEPSGQGSVCTDPATTEEPTESQQVTATSQNVTEAPSDPEITEAAQDNSHKTEPTKWYPEQPTNPVQQSNSGSLQNAPAPTTEPTQPLSSKEQSTNQDPSSEQQENTQPTVQTPPETLPPAETVTTPPPQPVVSEEFALKINGRISPFGDEHFADVDILIGEAFELVIEGSSGTVADVQWKMSKSDIVSVNGTTVESVNRGTVTLTTTYQGQHYTCIVRV